MFWMMSNFSLPGNLLIILPQTQYANITAQHPPGTKGNEPALALPTIAMKLTISQACSSGKHSLVVTFAFRHLDLLRYRG